MSLSRENIIQQEIAYFENSPLASEPAFISNYTSEYGEEGKCVYKTPEGRKCAVGALIKPALYQKEIDRGNGTSVLGLPDSIKNFLGEDNLSWLTKLQNCHDECARSWEEEKEYGDHNHFGRWFLACANEQGLLTA